jgi:hypothetical protein
LKNLFLSILVFSVDPTSHQVVLTTGPEYTVVYKVDKVTYNGHPSNLQELLNQQIKGKVLITEKINDILEVHSINRP